jgi:hypothetical protein
LAQGRSQPRLFFSLLAQGAISHGLGLVRFFGHVPSGGEPFVTGQDDYDFT